MLPINLDLRRFPLLLVGPTGEVVERERQLRGAGCERLTPVPCNSLPNPAASDALPAHRLLMVCAKDLPGTETLVQQAREHGLVTWVEDRREWCDFHLPALVRRGDLSFAISTGGRSPALAGILRRHLERLFPESWSQHLDEIAALRARLRSERALPEQIHRATEALIAREQWL